nr:site-2 protease family protein [Salsipaludibacter albus]
MDLPDGPVVRWTAAVAGAIGFFASILAHEVGHAIAARRRGHHVHAVTLFVFGGVTEIDDDARRWQDEFAIAAVGPWVSLNLAALLGLVTAGLDWYQLLPTVATVLGMLGWLNLALALFNLVPGAPLDGGRVLRALLWPVLGSRRRASRVAAAMGILVGIGLWALAGLFAVTQQGALLSALWLTLVAAFIVAIAFGQWRAARPAAATADTSRDPTAATGDDVTTDRAAGRGVVVGRWVRSGLSVALVVLALLVVPMPLIEESPGPTFDVGPTIELSGDTTPLDGEFVMLTVFVRQPGIAEVVRARFSEGRTLRPIGEVVAPDQGTRDFFSEQGELFATSFEQAAAAALEAAGEDVVVDEDVVVAHVLPDGPAADVLRAGDVLVEADGSPVGSAEDLAARTATMEAGTSLPLVVRRDDREVDLDVVVGELPGGERVGLGVTVGMQLGDLGLPREVTQGDLRIGGPSAGLVTALTIYDRVAEEDLLAGRTIAVTGTMGVDGTVGAIGGIDEKVEGAVASGAELLLVPLAQVAEFEAASDGRVPVIGVATLDGAISALRGT